MAKAVDEFKFKVEKNTPNILKSLIDNVIMDNWLPRYSLGSV